MSQLPTDRAVAFGTVGTSFITDWFADTVRDCPAARLQAVASRSAEQAARKAAEYCAPTAHDSFAALLADADVDAVYVASPNSVHFEQARDALLAGKHVLVEKPAVLRVVEWDELTLLAATHGLVLLEAMRTPYDAGSIALRDLLATIGPMRRVSLRYESRSSRYGDLLAGRRANVFDPAMGGGALRDLGCYVIAAMVNLFGAPSEVQGASVAVHGVDGAGAVLADYDDFVVDLGYSKITSTQLPSEIQGEDATLVIDHIASPRHIVTHAQDGATTETRIDGKQHSLVGELDRFVQLVQAGPEADATEDQAATRTVLSIIEQLATPAP